MNPHQVLEIPEGSDQETIRQAFYKQSRIWHPDKNKNGDEQFRKIVQAYKILTENPEPIFFENNSYWANNITLQNIEEMFRDIENMSKTPIKYLELPLLPSEIYNGAKKEATVTVCRICLTCQGTAWLSKNCRACSRSGTVMQEKKFVIDIKIGTLAGQCVIFIGEGDELPGMLPGDVKFKIVIKDDDNWSIDHRNQLKKTVDIDLGNCFWEPEIYIRTLDTHDKYLRVTSHKRIISTVLSGDRFYVDGRSKPCYFSEKNDGKIFLNFKVRFPKTISAELQENLKKFLPYGREFKNTQKINNGNQKNALKEKPAVLMKIMQCLPTRSGNDDSENIEEAYTIDRKDHTITEELQVPKRDYNKYKYDEMKEEKVSEISLHLQEKLKEIENNEQEEISVLQCEQNRKMNSVFNLHETESEDMKNKQQNEILEVKDVHEMEMKLRQEKIIDLDSFEIIEEFENKHLNEAGTELDGLKDKEHKNSLKIMNDLLTKSHERELEQVTNTHKAQINELKMKHEMENFKIAVENETELNKTITFYDKERHKIIIKSQVLIEQIAEQYPSKQEQRNTYDSQKMDTTTYVMLEDLEEGDQVINFQKQLANNILKTLDNEYN